MKVLSLISLFTQITIDFMSLIHHVGPIFWPRQLLWQRAMVDNHIALELGVESHMESKIPTVP